MATKSESSPFPAYDPRYDLIEDRLDHVEKEIQHLREEISRPGILTLPEAALFSLKSPAANAGDNTAKLSPLATVVLWLLDIARWFLSLIGPVLQVCLVPWVRNVVFGFLTIAILFSDWWLPFSTIWILGAIWERSILLLMAGVWWWLLAMYFADRPKKSLSGPLPASAAPPAQNPRKAERGYSTTSPAERFGARAG